MYKFSTFSCDSRQKIRDRTFPKHRPSFKSRFDIAFENLASVSFLGFQYYVCCVKLSLKGRFWIRWSVVSIPGPVSSSKKKKIIIDGSHTYKLRGRVTTFKWYIDIKKFFDSLNSAKIIDICIEFISSSKLWHQSENKLFHFGV